MMKHIQRITSMNMLPLVTVFVSPLVPQFWQIMVPSGLMLPPEQKIDLAATYINQIIIRSAIKLPMYYPFAAKPQSLKTD